MGKPVFYREFGKRLLDIVLSTIALVVLAPLLVVLALAVRWRLGRPILFWQQRPGKLGQLFWVAKFRTMADSRDPAGNLLDDSERLTPFGKWLRSTSLDELPELWNVLRGEMSFVGPRPLLPEYLPCYAPEQARRHDVRPGITGWAQVNGRNAISWEEKFELDVWYVEHQSLALDLKILLRTVATLLSRKGIAANDHVTMPRFDRPATRAVIHERAA
ncbi:MAG TPA: sugar transferase [Lacipirellulaceae bacterium]|nr:sugar transferase [Lacipirellulaceae bacterium]